MFNKKFIKFATVFLLWHVGTLLAQSNMPCNVPPFLAQKVPPNIFVIMDNSGSMGEPAYEEAYNPNKKYYGYFDPDRVYRYSNNQWVPTSQSADFVNYWPGNLLNWAIMSRFSVLKKVLVGGKATARSPRGFAHTLECESRRTWTKTWSYGNYEYAFVVSGTITTTSSTTISRRRLNSSIWEDLLRNATNKVAIDSTFSRGVIQKLGDRDADGRWDDDAPRFWLIIFNANSNSQEMDSTGRVVSVSNEHDGGRVESYYQGNESMSDFVNRIQNAKSETWTPLAECLLETMRYFQQLSPLFNRNDFNTGPNWDPMEPKSVWCRKSFVLLLTDGQATRDRDRVLQDYIGDYDGDGREPRFYRGVDDPQYSSHYLDDVALYMHTNDLRPDIPGTQDLTLYGVFVFGYGHDLLREACKKGGFIDYNGNRRPDLQREWDQDGDGVPDTYYEAQDGWEIERAIMDAILAILARVGSATSASVVTQTQRGEGTIYQAFFQPSFLTSAGEVKWIGELVGYFVDKNGNIREDSDHNFRLTTNDYLLRFRIDGIETKVERWAVTTDDNPLYKVDEVSLWDVNFLWSAGRMLLNKSPQDRNIKAIVKQGGNYLLVDFKTSNLTTLGTYIDGTDGFKDSLINYIRGYDYNNPTWRSRLFEPGKVWKLGDIVYSTPTFVGKPTERYDLVYNDESYRQFYNLKRNRRNIVLVGANDGMLHAFNAGIFDTLLRSVDGLGKGLGEELWAVIPMNLLPHLKWLKEPSYCHVYYVDLKPKVTDVKIFNPDRDHPEGWGTVAIVGMRLGGTPISVSNNTYRSSYFALDISNPDNPKVLWEFTDINLGYTISYPSVLKVVEGNTEKWFVVFGSGTTTTPSGRTSEQNAYFYVLDLKTGSLLRKIMIPYPSSANQPKGAFCGGPISVDVKLDYSCDVIYLPVTYVEKSGNAFVEKGALYRIVTNNKVDPANWQLSMAMNVPVPLTSGAAASMDEYGNLWVFFGSGKYFTDDDETDFRDNYFIGFKDPYWNGGWNDAYGPSHSLSELLNATNIKVKVDTSGRATVENAPGLPNNLSFEAFVDSVNRRYKGWYVVLPQGERTLSFPLVTGGAVLFTSYKPNNDPCGFGGSGWLYVLFYKTGTAAKNAPLGISGGYALKAVSVQGMPASPAVHIGSRDEARAVVQTSTGEVISLPVELPWSPKSGARVWRPANF
ncbi:MAG: PilC/PilY family type IV pilus protein [candidate division WOR-3 bacterium]